MDKIEKSELEEIIKNYLLSEGREIIENIIKNLDNKLETRQKSIIELDDNIIRKKEVIQDFIKELNNYSEKEEVKIKVGQLKTFIIKVFNLNEELESQKIEFIKKTDELKTQEENLQKNVNILKIKCKSYENEKENLDKNINELKLKRDRLEEEINNQKEKIDIKEKKIKNLEIINEECKNEIEKLKKIKQDLKETTEKIKQENENLNKEINKFEGISILQKLYDEYLKISIEHRAKLGRLIKTDDVNSFIACCYNIGTMDDLWDFLNIEVRNGKLEDAYILRNIFEYFILSQNKKYDESLYKLLIPNIGEEFDPTKHMSIDGVNSGIIKEIIFPGYGIMETKTTEEQTDDKRKFKKIRKLAMVKIKI